MTASRIFGLRASVCSLAMVPLSGVACADDGNLDGAGAGGAGGAEDGGRGGRGASNAEAECYQIAEWTKMTPHPDFAACAIPPNASCDRASFCGPLGCGGKESSFDVNGCRRQLCEEDTDCGEGQRCYDTGAGNPIANPCAATEYACCPVSDGCYCFAQMDCSTEKHCVDESEL